MGSCGTFDRCSAGTVLMDEAGTKQCAESNCTSAECCVLRMHVFTRLRRMQEIFCFPSARPRSRRFSTISIFDLAKSLRVGVSCVQTSAKSKTAHSHCGMGVLCLKSRHQNTLKCACFLLVSIFVAGFFCYLQSHSSAGLQSNSVK